MDEVKWTWSVGLAYKARFDVRLATAFFILNGIDPNELLFKHHIQHAVLVHALLNPISVKTSKVP